MKKNRIIQNISVNIGLAFILILFGLNGCMMMGMRMGKPMMSSYSIQVQRINKGQTIEEMIDEAVLNLSQKNLNISSVAVWQIKSKTAGVDVEMIRQKLITRLVNLDRFKVIARARLSELLDEHSLSLSGTIDEKNAVEIGKLIGVEGFIDGYAAIENNRLSLSLTLIETRSGVIVWAKTIERSDSL